MKRNGKRRKRPNNEIFETLAFFLNANALLAGFLLFSGGCNPGEPQPDVTVDKTTHTRAALAIPSEPGDPLSGKVVYEKYCHYCHGPRGHGNGPVGIAVSPHPADFTTDKKRMNKTDEELFESISEGIRKDIGGDEMAMPAWKSILTPREIMDVVAYVRQLSETKRE